MAQTDKQPAYLSHPAIRWIEYRLPIFSTLDHFVGTSYPAPRNLTYWWNFGSIAGFMLVVMIVSCANRMSGRRESSQRVRPDCGT